MPLSRDEQLRYSRHLLLPQVGLRGQERLARSRILIVGAGGLGSPAALYLAAAGVGTLGIADGDAVDVTNLQRQVLHRTETVGHPKVDSAVQALQALNPHVTLIPYHDRLTSHNALEIVRGYDLVIDGTDNLPTRYLLNDACSLLGVPLIYGAIYRFEGQVAVFDARTGPCYRCLFPEPPPPQAMPSCAEGGVLGVLAGTIGTWQATAALQTLLGIGDPLPGRLFLYDALAFRLREVRIAKQPACPLCGTQPTITGLADYEEFCGITGAACPSSAWEITPEALADLLADGPVQCIDIRQEWEREDSPGLPGAHWIPEHEMAERMAELDLTRDTVVFCTTGARSWHVAGLLRQAGIARAWSLRGGLLRLPPTLIANTGKGYSC